MKSQHGQCLKTVAPLGSLQKREVSPFGVLSRDSDTPTAERKELTPQETSVSAAVATVVVARSISYLHTDAINKSGLTHPVCPSCWPEYLQMSAPYTCACMVWGAPTIPGNFIHILKRQQCSLGNFQYSQGPDTMHMPAFLFRHLGCVHQYLGWGFRALGSSSTISSLHIAF